MQEIKVVLLNAMLFVYIAQVNTLSASYIANAKRSLIIKSYGQVSEFGAYLSDDLNAEITTNSAAPMNFIIYINTQADLATSDLDTIRHELNQGAIAILDGTSGNHNGSNHLSKHIGGLGFNSPVIMIKFNSEQKPEYKSLSFFTGQNLATDRSLFSRNELQKMATETHAMLSGWSKEKATRSDRLRSQINRNCWSEIGISVELRHVGYPCMVGKDYVGNSITGVSRWADEMIDACDGKASVSLFYTIDLLRSVSSDDGSTEDAKFLRITLNPAKEGGAGWHFSDAPSHKTIWYESRANRIEWFGPIVEDYAISFASRDPELRLHHTIPSSTERYSNIVELSSIKIKAPQALQSNFKPAAFMARRAVAYKNYEYTITNRSSDIKTATADWLWSREFKTYSGDWRTHTVCQLWCDDPFFDDKAFSAAAYAHFSPGYSVTFKVPSEKNDHSSILFSGAANVVALAGRVQYKFLLQHYSPWSSKGTVYRFSQMLTVNWGSEFFSSEMPLSLEVLGVNSDRGLCLNVIESDIDEGVGHINVYDCHFNLNQMWGADTEDHYKSLLMEDLCLTREEDNTVTVRHCTGSINQKWAWEYSKLANHEGGYLTASNEGDVIMTNDLSEAYQWRGFLRKPRKSGTLSIQSLPAQ